MAVIIVLIAISLIIAIGFLTAFLWSVRSGQYDDTYSPSVRMLFDGKVKVRHREGRPDATDKDHDKNHISR